MRLNGLLFAMMALLNSAPTKAGDYIAINEMPAQIHNLMDSEGYAINQNKLSIPKLNTNLLNNLQFIEGHRIVPLLPPAKITGWSLWNSSSFKYVGRNYDQINLFAPLAALSHYEYNITYSFEFFGGHPYAEFVRLNHLSESRQNQLCLQGKRLGRLLHFEPFFWSDGMIGPLQFSLNTDFGFSGCTHRPLLGRCFDKWLGRI